MKCSLLKISSYIDGELNAHKSGELEAHIAGCQRCQAGLNYLSDEVELISALATVHVPDHSTHELLTRLDLIAANDPLPEANMLPVSIQAEPSNEKRELAGKAKSDQQNITSLPPTVTAGATAGHNGRTTIREPAEASSNGGPEEGDNSSDDPSLSKAMNPPVSTPPTKQPPRQTEFGPSQGPRRARRPGLLGQIRDWFATWSALNRPENQEFEKSATVINGRSTSSTSTSRTSGFRDTEVTDDISETADLTGIANVFRPQPIEDAKTISFEQATRINPEDWQDEEVDYDKYRDINDALYDDDFEDESSVVGMRNRPSRPSIFATGISGFRKQFARWQAHPQRNTSVFWGLTVLLMIIGLIIGKTTTGLPSKSTTSTASSGIVQQHSPPAASNNAISPNPSAAATATPSASVGSLKLTDVRGLGNGGTGYKISDIRYGVHPNDFRIVFDLAAGANSSGAPQTIIGFSDPQTLIIEFSGVTSTSSIGSLPNASTVTSITLMQPSPVANATVYQLKLAHAVKLGNSYLSSPTRLVLDLTQ